MMRPRRRLFSARMEVGHRPLAPHGGQCPFPGARDGGLVLIKSDVFYKNLRNDPRYTVFLRKMNFPT